MDWISEDINAAAVTQDLTTIDIVRDELSLKANDTSKDAFLKRAISQTSLGIANYCHRRFWPELVTETQQIEQDPYPYQTPAGVRPLQLLRFPLISVISVVQVYPIKTSNPLSEGKDYFVDKQHGWLQRLNPFTGVACAWESVPTIIQYIGGYGALPTENYTVTATAPAEQYTVTKASTFSFDNGVSYVSSGAALTKIASGTPAVGQYTVTSGGVYQFAAADVGNAVAISYAYSSIPDDLVDACLRMVTQRFYQKDRDPMLMSLEQPNLGSKRWWVSTGSSTGKVNNGAIPPEVQGLLEPYRQPAFA